MGDECKDAGGDLGGPVREPAARVGDEADDYFRLIATINDIGLLLFNNLIKWLAGFV